MDKLSCRPAYEIFDFYSETSTDSARTGSTTLRGDCLVSLWAQLIPGLDRSGGQFWYWRIRRLRRRSPARAGSRHNSLTIGEHYEQVDQEETEFAMQHHIDLNPKGCDSSIAPPSVKRALNYGFEKAAIHLAISFGQHDVNRLTELVFCARHPELERQPVVKTEMQFNDLLREWQDIREKLVQPALSNHLIESEHNPDIP